MSRKHFHGAGWRRNNRNRWHCLHGVRVRNVRRGYWRFEMLFSSGILVRGVHLVLPSVNSQVMLFLHNILLHQWQKNKYAGIYFFRIHILLCTGFGNTMKDAMFYSLRGFVHVSAHAVPFQRSRQNDINLIWTAGVSVLFCCTWTGQGEPLYKST